MVFVILAIQFLSGHRFPDLKRLGLPCSADGRISDVAVDSIEALTFLANFDSSSDGHLVIEEGHAASIKGAFFEPVAVALVSVHVMDLSWAGKHVYI